MRETKCILVQAVSGRQFIRNTWRLAATGSAFVEENMMTNTSTRWGQALQQEPMRDLVLINLLEDILAWLQEMRVALICRVCAKKNN